MSYENGQITQIELHMLYKIQFLIQFLNAGSSVLIGKNNTLK